MLTLRSSTAAVLFSVHSVIAAPLILVNQVGYGPHDNKKAIIQGTASETFEAFQVCAYPSGDVVYKGQAGGKVKIESWKDWHFSPLDFSSLKGEGTYFVECHSGTQTVRSCPFLIQKDILERRTLSDVLFYFKGMRCSGPMDKADRKSPFKGSKRQPVDVRGGWFDASGDYGKHLSHLNHSIYFNPQQIPLVVYHLLATYDLLHAREGVDFNQIKRRLVDEALFGADFLVRMHDPKGSFYQSVMAPGPGKKPEDRCITPRSKPKLEAETPKALQQLPDAGLFDISYRQGGGVAIAGLARAARCSESGDFEAKDYLKAAEEAFAFLEAHNLLLSSNGKENIVDDYCALLAATELFKTTKKPAYAASAQTRAEKLVSRQVGYWCADDKDRPFFHAADAGLPVVSLLEYLPLANAALKAKILDAVKAHLEHEIKITHEVANPFGLARQVVQNKAGKRRTAFFFPHDTETAPWWQGENARLGSLSAAARLAMPHFKSDPGFQARLKAHAENQLNWILGLNPYDACMLQGHGRNNPEYLFFSSYQYKNLPGGIVNGITSGHHSDDGIDFNIPYAVTGKDDDWRWGEQWLPHTAWYLLAVAAI